MNERIQELAREADKLWDGASPEDPEWCEKFAQLIIAECCVALHPMLRDMISRTQGVDMIVKHFRGEE
jgi:hypothetical protein